MLTLLESSKYSQDTLKRGVAETFVMHSNVLQMLPFMTITGNAYAYNEEKELPGIAFRGVNESYTESTGVINQKSEKLVILGGDADVDKFQVQTQGNLNDLRAVQTNLKVKALAYKFQDQFFNGDVAVDAKGFDGLKKRIVGDQLLVADVNGLNLSSTRSDANVKKFMELMDSLIYNVDGKADALFMDSKTLIRLKSIARDLGYMSRTEDAFGRSIDAYDGVPLFDAGTKTDGTKVIGHAETCGTNTKTTSIYAVKFGADEYVSGLTNGGVQVYDLGELESKPSYRTRIEFYNGIGIFNSKACARLSGLQIVD